MSPRDVLSNLLGSQQQEYTLVVLGGETQDPPGFLLGAARLSVGAGEADDVFLSGVGVVPGHLRLVFLDGQVTLLSATEEVRIDGQPVLAFPADLQPLQTLSLSPDTHLSYGPAGSKWPEPIDWPLPAAEAVGEGAVPVVSAPKLRPMRATRTVKQHVVHSARLSGVVVGVAALLAVGVVLSDLIWGNREVVNPGAAQIDRSAEVLEDFLAREPRRLATVQLLRRPDGALTLRGFVDSEVTYQELSEKVRQQVVRSGGNVRLDALSRERLEGLVRDQIGRYPMGSQLDIGAEDIKLRIYGVQTEGVDPERLRAELARLKERVLPRVMTMDIELEPLDRVSGDVAQALARSPITREFQFSVVNASAVVSGIVAPSAEEEARRILGELQASMAQRVPLTFDLKVDPKLNFTLVGLTIGGETSTATLVQRGRVESYRVGEAVFGTGELREIRRNGVVIALGRRELFIPMSAR